MGLFSKLIGSSSNSRKEKNVNKDSKLSSNPSSQNNLQTRDLELFHDNGNLRTKGTIDSEGNPHGNCKEYYANGKIFKDQNYKHGIHHGNQKTYHENGNVFIDYNYKNGIQHGVNNQFYEDGIKDIIASFKDGDLHGLKEQFLVTLFLFSEPMHLIF